MTKCKCGQDISKHIEELCMYHPDVFEKIYTAEQQTRLDTNEKQTPVLIIEFDSEELLKDFTGWLIGEGMAEEWMNGIDEEFCNLIDDTKAHGDNPVIKFTVDNE
jgi:hypothetical protein